MADILLAHLAAKAQTHSDLKLLLSQWDMDEKLIAKGLQTVGHLFPHFSRHDASHSRQILINVERILGANIALLTATDTWLILEAAYLHDIGMVVPSNHLREAFSDSKFAAYVESIHNNPADELFDYVNSRYFDWSSKIDFTMTPLDAFEKFRLLMSEWFRRQHADRSLQITQSPWEQIGLTSPRTELIPSRLFRTLGQICQMHGKPFNEMLHGGGLPFKETGMAQEPCHPRFVASLLRLGDLLDVDDNRFCPILQGIAGPDRQALTKAHEEKHSSIRHLRIDQQVIELSAECSTVAGYVETFKWFDWLAKELQDQMNHWQDIAPSPLFGALPNLKQRDVRLLEYDLLTEGESPKFRLDDSFWLKYLRGSNLYESEFSCFRELLQNAVDATLLKIWLEADETFKEKLERGPFDPSVQQKFKENAVDIAFIQRSINQATNTSSWKIEIKDVGTGISHSDLHFMTSIGGSHKNQTRLRQIQKMPEWMKPSGAFGIGFQSVFHLVEEVKIKTKSMFSHDTYSVVFNSPIGPNQGLFLPKKLKNEFHEGSGTKVEFVLTLENFASSWSLGFIHDSKISAKFARSVDTILDTSFPYAAGLIADKINEFGKNSLIPLKGQMHCLAPQQEIQLGDSFDSTGSLDAKFYSSKKGGESTIRFSLSRNSSVRSTFSYRGQPFNANELSFPFAYVDFDILHGKADYWLKNSRDEILQKRVQELRILIYDLLAEQIEAELPAEHNQFAKQIRSLFVSYQYHLTGKDCWQNIEKQLQREWLELSAFKLSEQRYSDLLQKKEFKLWLYAGNGKILRNRGKEDMIVSESDAYHVLPLFIAEWLNEPQNSVQIVANEIDYERDNQFEFEKSILGFHFNKSGLEGHSEEALAKVLMDASGQFGNARYVMPTTSPWNRLALAEDTSVTARRLFHYYGRFDGLMVVPFLFQDPSIQRGLEATVNIEKLDALCRWVQPRLRENISVEEVHHLYTQFISYIDQTVMSKLNERTRWQTVRGLAN